MFVATRHAASRSRADDGPTQVILPLPDRSRVLGVCLGGEELDTLFAFCGDKIWKRKVQHHALGLLRPGRKSAAPNYKLGLKLQTISLHHFHSPGVYGIMQLLAFQQSQLRFAAPQGHVSSQGREPLVFEAAGAELQPRRGETRLPPLAGLTDGFALGWLQGLTPLATRFRPCRGWDAPAATTNVPANT